MDKLTTSLVVDLFNNTLIEGRSWQPLAEGVMKSNLYEVGEDGPRAALLRYEPGAKVDHHIHSGYEHILILQGSQCDGDKTYLPGMLVIHAPGTSHAIVSNEGCLALGIWEKPVYFQ